MVYSTVINILHVTQHTCNKHLYCILYEDCFCYCFTFHDSEKLVQQYIQDSRQNVKYINKNKPTLDVVEAR